MKGISILDKFLSGLLVLLVLGLTYTAITSVSNYISMSNQERQRIGQPYCAQGDIACLQFDCGYDYMQTTSGRECAQSVLTGKYTSEDFTAWQLNIFFDIFIGEINSFLTMTASLIFTAIVKWLVGLVRKGQGVLSLNALRRTKMYGIAITLISIFLSLIAPVTIITQTMIENWGGRIPMFPYLMEAFRKVEIFNFNVNMMLIGLVLVVFAYALEKMLVYKAEVDLTI